MMDSTLNNDELDINNKEMVDLIPNNETYIKNILHDNCDKIISEYLYGNWENFFHIWHVSFSSVVKETIEYKILTLKLRVHYAILPIRVILLQENNKKASDSMSKVSIILKNTADKLDFAVEKSQEGDQSKLAIDSMKQLEDFLNSNDGQKLTFELKDNSLKTLFALPYIVNPHKDESMKKIFSTDWLEELTVDLQKFINKCFQDGLLLSEKESISEHYHTSYNLSEFNKFHAENHSLINNFSCDANNDKSKLNKNNSDISCNQIIHSAIKNKDIQEWIASDQNIINGNLHTKSTQTRISGIKSGTGFSLISEPHHIASVVTPNIFIAPRKQSILYNDELNLTKSRLFTIHKHYRKLKMKFYKLHEDYQKMNDIAEKLTITLEESVRGQPVNLDTILETCMKIFPDRFNRNLQTDSEDTSTNMKEEFSKNILSTKVKQNILYNILVPPKLLDYNKIKFHLKNGNIKSKLFLLQALRQKLTLTQPEHRDETVHEYINNDLLGIQGNILNIYENNILSYILQPTNSDISVNLIQQSASRFLNALASLSNGRLYLATGPVVLNAIIKYLDTYSNGDGNPTTFEMLLATLQKMSLRKQQRNYMIEANLVEWLIHHLSSEHFKIGSYRLEYACALLMNLSFQSAARIRASAIAPLFISTMISLLTTDCILILPYVNGALQNFLLNNEINEEAKRLHLGEILEFNYVENDQELRKHFSHTLKIHKRECDKNLSDDEFPDEEDEIFDYLENELEEGDPTKGEIEDLQGEKLLSMYYSLPNYDSELKNSFDKRMVENCANTISHKESKKTGSSSTSTIIAGSEITFVDSKTKANENKSGTGVANASNKMLPPIKNEVQSRFKEEEEEEAFLAKPKLMRTPPPSARTETNLQGKVTRKVQGKMN